MKRVLVGLAVLAVTPWISAAASDERLITEATAPLPEHLRAGARVVVTDADGNERVLREGSNGFQCGPDDPEPGFAVGCVEESVSRFFDSLGPIMARAASPSETLDLIDAAVKERSVTPPTPGSRVYVLSGPDRERARPTMSIFLPGATGQSTGLSTERSDGTWLMCPGTPSAHIMVGDVTYGQDENLWKTCGR